MDRQTLVRQMLSRGIMLTPQALEKAMKNGPESVLGGHVQQAPAAGAGKNAEKLSVIVKSTPMQRKITPEDAISAGRKRYEILRKLVLRKAADAVSVNNALGSSAGVCVVGEVKEVGKDGFRLEDLTGAVKVSSKEHVSENDIIGVRGWIRNNSLFAEEVIYPDIPIGRDIPAIEGRVLFTGGRTEPLQDADVIVTPDTVFWGKNERRIPNPAWLLLERGGKKAAILAYNAGRTVGKDEAIVWLRRRYIGDTAVIPDTETVLNDIPDILYIIGGNEPWTANYKGVTVISSNNKKHVIVEMKTRTVRIL